MLLATIFSDLLLWSLVGAYVGREVLNQMFGADWLKQLGDAIRQRWLVERGESYRNES